MANTCAEIISILLDTNHPQQKELVKQVVDFCSKEGIIKICFGLRLDPVPGEGRREKVESVLHGLIAGDKDAIHTMVAFIEESGAPFSFLFREFLGDKEET